MTPWNLESSEWEANSAIEPWDSGHSVKLE